MNKSILQKVQETFNDVSVRNDDDVTCVKKVALLYPNIKETIQNYKEQKDKIVSNKGNYIPTGNEIRQDLEQGLWRPLYNESKEPIQATNDEIRQVTNEKDTDEDRTM